MVLVWFKFNFDGSKLDDGKTSFGFTIRNHYRDLCLAGAMALSSDCSIIQAEAWGLREGLRATLFLGIDSLEVEGDDLVVINAIRQCWKVPWAIRSLVMDSLVDLQSFNAVSINHCFRKANQAADYMTTRVIFFRH